MKHILIAILILISWFIFISICLHIFNGGNNNDIVFSILYLCVVVGVSTSLILDKISKNKDK
jgi:hypothetical protein